MNKYNKKIETVQGEISSLQKKLTEKKRLLHDLELKQKEEEKKERIEENERLRKLIEERYGSVSPEEVLQILDQNMNEDHSNDGSNL
ncbi:hypothetical protein ACTQ1O_05835 [Bilifractor sp. LCP21S3_A7]|uniref:hypothetical protein n=1 Tax=Bilifractor sp. LCP21S3_A7 TaxID=3438738 RepID=UPI003F8EDF17